MKLSHLPISLGVALVLFAGCKKGDNPRPNTSSTIEGSFTSGTREGSTETGANANDLVENTTFSTTVTINFGTTVTITNPLDGNGVTITTNGSDVTINSTVAGVAYVLSGATTDGSVKVYSSNDYKITLSSVTIINNDGPALNLQSTKRAFVEVSDGLSSTLKDGTSYATSTEDQKGALFAEGPLVFSGKGVLVVSGLNNHAVCSDQYIRVREGNLYVDAVSDGIHAGSGFILDGGYLKAGNSVNGVIVEAGAAIVNDGSLEIDVTGSGFATTAAAGVDPYININGGSVYVTSLGGRGLQSAGDLTINNGSVDAYFKYIVFTTENYGLSAKKNIYINGGYVGCKGYNGLHTDGNLTVTGGVLIAYSQVNISSGIDCPTGTFKITGGSVLGGGLSTSIPDSTVSTINSIVLSGTYSNTVMHLERSNNGKEVMTFQTSEALHTVFYASSKIEDDARLDLYIGGDVTGNVGTDTVVTTYGNIGGLYKSGYYVGVAYTPDNSFKITSRVMQIGGVVK